MTTKDCSEKNTGRCFMCLLVLSVMIAGSLQTVAAESAVQTDWSGGNGVYGPVTDWGSQFCLSLDIAWDVIPGGITLPRSVKHYISSTSSAYWICADDIDGDGDVDAVTSSLFSDIYWLENTDGSGTSWTEHLVNDDIRGSVSTGDLDGDGDMDIAVCNWQGSLDWFENSDGQGNTWIRHTLTAMLQGLVDVHCDDINGNGIMDIISASHDSSDVSWWGGPAWIKHVVSDSCYQVSTVHSGDLDGDGDQDILAGCSGLADVLWWENTDGSGTSWTEHIVDASFDGVEYVFSGDMDGDGDTDVAAASGWLSDVVWWENANGAGTSWVEHTIVQEFGGASSVFLEDLDGDGDTDALVTANDDNEIAWFENTGGPEISWKRHTVETAYEEVYEAVSADIDGNGVCDALSCSRPESDVSWWDLLAFKSSGFLESSVLDTRCSPQWASIEWNDSEPSGTEVYFQYRTSDDPFNMGFWSDPVYSPCSLSGMLDMYFQYRAILETSVADTAPVLEEVVLNWDPTGIEGGAAEPLQLMPFAPNPSPSPVVRFNVYGTYIIAITVFDVAGRTVFETGIEFPAGCYGLRMNDLSPGIYLCRMTTVGYAATQRFVVVNQQGGLLHPVDNL